MNAVRKKARLLLVAVLVSVPGLQAQERAIRPHTYELALMDQSSGTAARPMLVEGTELRTPLHYGLIEVRDGASAVAIVQMHQVLFVANRTVEGERVFVATGQGATYEIEADRMEVQQNGGMILFWVGGDLVAVLNPNSVQVVADRDAQVGSGTDPSR